MNWPAESYWQRGCDDAKVGREPQRPFPSAAASLGWGNYLERVANEGYMNGWKFGHALRARVVHEPAEDEGSQP